MHAADPVLVMRHVVRQRRRDQYVGAGEIRLHAAAAVALAAIMTAGTPIQWLGEYREPRWDARHAQLIGRLLDEELVAARLRRRLKDAIRLVRQILMAAEEADQPVDPIVVRCNLPIRDRPIVAESVPRLPLEIARAEAERDAPPVIGAAAEHPRPPPEKLRPWRDGVRLTFDLPAPVARVELSKWTSFRPRASARGRIRRQEHLA